MDGIDAKIISAVENPPSAKKKKKKKRGFFSKKRPSIPPKEKIKPTVDMKRFHWQTVGYDDAKNSIWKTMDEKNVTQTMNIKEFEGLFSIPKKTNKIKELLKGKDKAEEKKKADEEIKFVSAKRQYNVELLLKRLKFNGAILCDDIVSMNEQKLNLDTLIKISDMVPSDEEQMQAIGCSDNHNKKRIEKYGIVERFFYDLSSVWSIQERIKLWIFKKEFATTCQHQSDKIDMLNKGMSDINNSEALYEVFKIILAFGNYMNGGKRNGAAYGFSLDTLRMLSGTKGTDGKTTLLMYIYKHCKTHDVGHNVVKELENVSAAVRIDIDYLDKKIKEIDGELNKLPERIKEFEVQTKKNKKDVYVKVMRDWMKDAKVLMDDLKKSFSEMNKRAIELAKMYAYKLEDGEANTFLKIFDDFIKDWNKAKIKYTKLEEKKKKDALKAKRKAEAQKKLEDRLNNRTVTKKQLEKKNIFKTKDKVKQEQALKSKLKLTMKAHVRKQTAMQAMFNNVLNVSDEEEEDDETEDEQEQNPYKQYMKAYQNGPRGPQATAQPVTFNPDSDNETISRAQSMESDVESRASTIIHHTSVDLPLIQDQLSLDHDSDKTVMLSPYSTDSNVNTDSEILSKSQSVRDSKDVKTSTSKHIKENKSLGDLGKKKKKKNDREHNATPHLLNQSLKNFKYRGKGTTSDKYQYPNNAGLFQKGRKPVPTATQFNSVWEQNFTPISRGAFSHSNKRPGIESNRKKAKKAKYRSGHVRRETRLKQAFEQMNKMQNWDASQLGAKDADKKKDKLANNRLTANKSAKTKGKEMYSKYGRKSKNNTPRSSNNVAEF